MNFQESVDYLNGLGYELSVKKFGLENTFTLLKALKNPEKKYLKVQVAGTNGKGSTCAFLSAICVSAGIKVGLNTSPHLVSITERIKINDENISEADFARQATHIRSVSEKLVETGELEALPTFFEQVTAIALNYFAEQNVEIAILETGLGGRFDATTAAKAEIVAITPIDYDHQKILGATLTEIASEKAAIIREDTKIVIGNQPEEVMNVILEKCAKFGVSPNLAINVRTACVSGRENLDDHSISDFRFQISNFQTSRTKYQSIRLNLLGKHQTENAKVAILLTEILQEYFPIKSENIIKGLETAKHQGRLEFQGNILFDGAHNVSGAKALREYLNEFIENPITMIFGAMRDKDLTEIGEILFPKAEKLILTKPDNPRSMETADLLEFVPKNFSDENVFIAENVGKSIEKAREIVSENGLILVTGSLYLVGEAQKILKHQSEI